MKILHVSVVEKVATYQKRDGVIVCGNNDYQIEFSFDSEWSKHQTKIARFIVNGTYKDVTFTGTTCHVPVLSNTDLCTIGVYAGNLDTTTRAEIPCLKSILCEGAPAGEFPIVQPIGEKGDDGLTPYIGENGNWFIGDTDLGVAATGELDVDYEDNETLIF